jgi:hypothetical protein
MWFVSTNTRNLARSNQRPYRTDVTRATESNENQPVPYATLAGGVLTLACKTGGLAIKTQCLSPALASHLSNCWSS